MKTMRFIQFNKRRVILGIFLVAAGIFLFGAVSFPKGTGYLIPEQTAGTAQNKPIEFVTDCGKARMLSTESGKPLLLFFTEPASPFSQRVEREFFADEEIAALSRGFVCASIDTGRAAAIPVMKKYAVTAAPTVLFVTSDGKMMKPITQFHSTAEFKSQMQAAIRPVAWQQASFYLR